MFPEFGNREISADEQGIRRWFVSVTQQFNTTTSMGRLTLNMLLSFAQFEREVTGERIRDKIAASKRESDEDRPPLRFRNEAKPAPELVTSRIFRGGPARLT